MTDKFDSIVRERQEISDQIFECEKAQRDLENFEERIDNIFRKNQNLFFEMESLYSVGELNYMSADLTLELNRGRQQVFNAIENQNEEIKNNRYSLEEKESELYYEQMRLSEEDS